MHKVCAQSFFSLLDNDVYAMCLPVDLGGTRVSFFGSSTKRFFLIFLVAPPRKKDILYLFITRQRMDYSFLVAAFAK